MQVDAWASHLCQWHLLWWIRPRELCRQHQLRVDDCVPRQEIIDHNPISWVQHRASQGRRARAPVHRHLVLTAAAACRAVRHVHFKPNSDIHHKLREGGVHFRQQCQLWWFHCQLEHGKLAYLKGWRIFAFILIIEILHCWCSGRQASHALGAALFVDCSPLPTVPSQMDQAFLDTQTMQIASGG